MTRTAAETGSVGMSEGKAEANAPILQDQEARGEGAFSPSFYEALLAHALTALKERKPFQINADGAYALIAQAAADRKALAALSPQSGKP
jgi:hypothetical protein